MTQQSKNPQPEDVGKHATKNKRPKPYKIEVRYIPGALSWLHLNKQQEWRTWGKYRTAAERDLAMEQVARKYSFNEYRAKDPE